MAIVELFGPFLEDITRLQFSTGIWITVGTHGLRGVSVEPTGPHC